MGKLGKTSNFKLYSTMQIGAKLVLSSRHHEVQKADFFSHHTGLPSAAHTSLTYAKSLDPTDLLHSRGLSCHFIPLLLSPSLSGWGGEKEGAQPASQRMYDFLGTRRFGTFLHIGFVLVQDLTGGSFWYMPGGSFWYMPLGVVSVHARGCDVTLYRQGKKYVTLLKKYPIKIFYMQ